MLVNTRQTHVPAQLRSGIANLDRRIAEHEEWIRNPTSEAGVELHPAEDIARWVVEKWRADIAWLKAQRADYEAALKE
jgi:hypothetical protein